MNQEAETPTAPSTTPGRTGPQRRLAPNQLTLSSVQDAIEAATGQAKTVQDLLFLAIIHARVSNLRTLKQYSTGFTGEDVRKDLMRVTALLREFRKQQMANLSPALELVDKLHTDSARREVVARMLTKTASNMNAWKKGARQRGLDFKLQTVQLDRHAAMLRTASMLDLVQLTSRVKVQAFMEGLLPVKA